MARFDSADDLRRALPSLLRSGVDLERLFQRTDTLGSALQLAHRRTPRAPKLSAAARARVQRELGDHPVRFVRRAPVGVHPLDTLPGQYDLVVGFRTAVITETLAALYDAHSIPHTIPGDTVASVLGPDVLQSIVTGLPANTSLGRLHLTSAPTVEVRPGIEALVVTLPFRLEYVKRGPATTPGPTVPRVVAVLAASLRFAIAANAKVDGGEIGLEFALDVVGSFLAEIEVAPDSSIQPAQPDSLAAHVRAKDGSIRLGLGTELNRRLADASIAPPYGIPGLDGDSLHVQLADTVVRVSSDGGSIVVGVVLKVGPELAQHSAVPSALTHLFDARAANVGARAASSLADKTLRAFHRSGALQELVDRELAESQPDASATVLDVSASFEHNRINLRLHMRIAGICVQAIDITYVVDLRFTVFQGVLHFERIDDVEDEGDDEIFCVLNYVGALAAFGLTAVAFLRPPSAPGVDAPAFFVSGLLASERPVPGTESLLTVELDQAAAFSNELASSATVKLLPDTRNTYVYARFFDVSPLGVRTPISDADVTLLDLDNPAPAADDAVPPRDRVVVAEGVQTTTTVHSFVLNSDEAIALGKTDGDGRVRFALTPEDLETTIGVADVETNTRNVDGDGGPPTTTRKRGAVAEPKPDLYFFLRRSDGSTISTQSSPIVNVEQGVHQGTAAAPLQFAFGGPANG